MAAPLLQTKLYIPPPHPRLVLRPHLLERLDASLRPGHKLILLTAPAGFGKTTLLAAWIASRGPAAAGPAGQATQPTPPLRAAWLSLDEADDDPVRFLAYLTAALQRAEPRLRAVGLAGSETALSSPERALAPLINELASLGPEGRQGSPLLLALDDYHAITAAPVHALTSFLLDHLPPTMHVAIAARTAPPLPLARLRARRELTELDESNLRFSTDEAAAFLNQVMGLGLSAGDISALEARTEGWIAGLHLAALSMQGQGDVSGFLREFGGSHRHLFDYLTDEVLQAQPEEVRSFLRQTSILGRLSAPLCDAVPGRSDGRAILESLERSHLFVVSLDDRREWVRYHPLFAEVLQAHLRRADPALWPILHRRAAEWYEAAGLAGEAIEHALAAADPEYAARVVESAGVATLMRSEVTTFLRWAEALPDDSVRRRPGLCLYHAWALFLAARPSESVLARLRDCKLGSGEAAGQGAFVLGDFLAAFQGQATPLPERPEQILASLPEEESLLRSLAAWYTGFAHLWRGDLAEADRTLDQAAEISRQSGNILLAVIVTCHRAELYALQGRLRAARALYGEALELAVDERGARLPIAGMALVGLGELARESGDLEGAARLLEEGIGLTEQWGVVGTMDGQIALARVRQAQGDGPGMLSALDGAAGFARRFDATELDDRFVAAHRARLRLMRGEVEAAADWQRDGIGKAVAGAGSTEGGDLYALRYLREIEGTVAARLLIGQGRPGEALALLGRLLPPMEEQGRRGSALELELLKALALQALGRTEAAVAIVAEALARSEEEGYFRTFVDQGEGLAPLLRLAAARGASPGYAGRLLVALRAAPAAGEPGGLAEPLVERELEVLRLIGAGLSNAEIAAELVIAPSTVKWHINNLYGKLGVRSRTQALARARELGLLKA